MKIKNVTVLGGGTLGSQIALQCYYAGYSVTIWDKDTSAIYSAENNLARVSEEYIWDFGAKEIPKGLRGTEKTLSRRQKKARIKRLLAWDSSITFTNNLEYAISEADIVIEAVVENPDIKSNLYKEMSPFLSKDTIIATNTSTLLPSRFAKDTGRPDKYLAMHFANHIWRNNIAEIMRHSGTSDETFETVVSFASSIYMQPICINKEQQGYILNSLLVPLLDVAIKLYAGGISDYKTIDTTWKTATGSPYGPFEMIDIIGIQTAYSIVKMKPRADILGTPENKAKVLFEKMLSRGAKFY